ncbi:MAG TPA: CBS domain-containing protein [Thiobacillus sp.]|jgi:CBS domain-containing membrane protein|nr:CBS domain-containing protein [Thiobacillus sp.]
MDAYLDVGKADLKQIYRRAGMYAHQRKMGEITCGDIMCATSSRSISARNWKKLGRNCAPQDRRHPGCGQGAARDRHHLAGGFSQARQPQGLRNLRGKLVKFIRRTPGVTSAKPEVVSQIMATPAVTAPKDMNIVELAPLLSDHGLHHIPIVNAEQRLVGMAPQSDLIAAPTLAAAGLKERCHERAH